MVWFAVLLAASPANAQILIFAAHPDDDILTSAGIVSDAHRRGEPVVVVYLTNGDYDGTSIGLERQDEAIAAQQVLGTSEDETIFLGYPDGYADVVYEDYPDSTDQFTTPSGQGLTYGQRGLGGADYHFYKFGAHALYNRANMVLDFASILGTYRPDHIFTTGQYDWHTDHVTAYNVLQDALNSSSPTHSINPSSIRQSYGLHAASAIGQMQ
jgi:LmbE family N-acetylglucosaminyl deacetylase